MTVRCKFVCASKREFKNGNQSPQSLYDYEFNAVYGDSEENKKFWQWTPSGKLSVTTVKDGQFEVGKEYYIDLSLVGG